MREEALLPPGWLVGRLVDADGVPLPGGRVRVAAPLTESKFAAPVSADGTGRFRVGPLESTVTAHLFVDAPGLGSERYPDVVVFPDQEHDLGDLVVPPGMVVEARVVEQHAVDGEAGAVQRPIADAMVRIDAWWHLLESTIERFGPQRTLRTDAVGRFVTEPLPGCGAVHFTISCDGFARADHWVHAKALPRRQDLGTIVLERERPIRGRIVDHAGAPVAGASVTADCDHDRRATSGDDGRFTLRGQRDARWLRVHAKGHGHGHAKLADATTAADGALEVTVQLPRAWPVRGRVVDAESGAPIVLDHRFGASLSYRSPARPDTSTCIENGSQLGPDGTFTAWYVDDLRDSRDTELELCTVADGYAPARVPLGLLAPEREIDGIVVRMVRREVAAASKVRTPLSGRVVGPDGAPWRGSVSLWHSLSLSPGRNAPVRRGAAVEIFPLPSQLARLDEEGRYAFDDVRCGAACLRVDRPGHPPSFSGRLEFTEGVAAQHDHVIEQPATLRGRFVDLPLGIAGHLWVITVGTRLLIVERRVDRSDQFELQLPPGRHLLRASSDALDWRRKAAPGDPSALYLRDALLAEVTLAPGESRDLGKLRLPQWVIDAYLADGTC